MPTRICDGADKAQRGFVATTDEAVLKAGGGEPRGQAAVEVHGAVRPQKHCDTVPVAALVRLHAGLHSVEGVLDRRADKAAGRARHQIVG